jgi:Ca-activated chloride channel family protein
MIFGNSRAWLVLLLALVMLALAHLQIKGQQKRLSSWIDRSMWSRVIPEFSWSTFLRRQVLLALAFLFAGVALMRPQWGEREELIDSKGMDIVFLLDLSNSILAEDTPPSRLDRARTFIKKTLDGLADDRVGIVGFAGKAVLAVPLTTDFGYVTEMVETLEPSMIASQGTEIAKAIDAGIKAFERSAEDTRKSSKAFVLITDGEDFGEGATAAASRIKDFGSGFFVVAVGTKEGAPVPVRNQAGVLQTYKKDRDQKVVLSRVNKDLLAQIASEGGGTLIDLVNPDDASYELVRGLRGLSRSSTLQQKQVTRIERYHYFLAVAVALLLMHLFTGYLPARKRIPSLLLLIVLLPAEGSALTWKSYLESRKAQKLYGDRDFAASSELYGQSSKREPESGILKYNQATALSGAGKAEEAIPLFEEVSKQALAEGDYESAARALYNEGVTLSQSGKARESLDRLTKAIELAKIIHDGEMEKRAREALTRSSQQNQQQQKQKQEQQKQDQEQKPKQDSGDQKSKPKDDGQEPQQKPRGEDQQKQGPEDGKKRQFRSGTLSKDVAESIMNDLSDREKQLHQNRLKEQRGREMENEKDW